MVKNMSRFCTNCGEKIDQNAKFCPFCGKKTIGENANTINQTQQSQNQVNNTVNPPNSEFTDIFVSCSPQSIKQAVQNIFQQNKFAVEWQTQFAGKAKRGSKGANFALGALAQYFEIDFQIYQTQKKEIAVRLMRSNIGLMGGAIGVHRVSKQFSQVVDMLSNTFYQMGIYKGRNPQ